MVIALPPNQSAAPNAGLMLGLGRRLAQIFRWALVLLLVADIIGTPLHRHHHDSGIDGSALHAQLAVPQHSAHHVEEDHHELDFVHAVTTLRAESRASAPDACADADLQDVALASAWVIPLRGSPVTARLAWDEADTALHRLHRSLPPAGRAPPLRA
jgi:hypothetical protein